MGEVQNVCQMTTYDAARVYIERYKDDLLNRRMGKKTLARLIIAEHPAHFTMDDLEKIRKAIRDLTGEGKGIKPVIMLNNDAHKGNLSKLPISVVKPRQEYNLPDGKYLVLSDIHLPFHDAQALETAIQEGKRQQVTGVYLNGDTMDMFQISNFTKFEKSVDIGEEVTTCNKFLAYLREQFPQAQIWYKVGNHEARFERYIWANMPQLAPLIAEKMGESMGLAALLYLEQYGVTYVGDRNITYAGDLALLHGHEFGSSVFSPVNPARGAFLRAKSSVLIGHHHQTSTHHEGNLAGDKIACFSTGCLCDLSPNYRPFAYTRWNHGAAVVEVKGKDFWVDNFRIENGKRY
jgi:hypothetical protein